MVGPRGGDGVNEAEVNWTRFGYRIIRKEMGIISELY